MFFSIIIPAYNAELTITRCLNSIYALSIQETEFEVIVIDDCSTDRTVTFIEEFKQVHPNIVLLKQPQNHRQGAARNRGLSIAKGKYVVFLDSDDEIQSGLISALEHAETSDLDMTIMKGGVIGSDGLTTKTYSLPYKSNEIFSGTSFQLSHRFWCTAPWPYLYRMSFLKRVDYPFAEDVLYEDSDFVNVHLYFAQRMGYCDKSCYLIHENPFSTTHTMSYKHVCDYALLGTRMLNFHNRIEDKNTPYADSILEGGSWNIMQSCKNLLKLDSQSGIRAFYDRFDMFADRKSLFHYREPAYCWTAWTRFCIRHRKMTTSLVGLCLSTGVTKLIRKRHR